MMFKCTQIFVSSLLVLCSSCLFGNQTQETDCGSACAISHIPTSSVEQGHINTKGLESLISSGIPLVILDARSGKWDDGKRIAHAKGLSDQATAEEVAEVIPAKNALVVVYCANNHCPASASLAKHLAALGYSNVLEYEGGIQEWMNAGHAVRDTR